MIAKNASEHLSHTSRALRELSDKGLIRCVTPTSSKNRFFEITPKGKELLAKVKEIEGPKNK